MSNPRLHTGRMKNRIKPFYASQDEQLITTFGNARLIRQADGTTTLRGGHVQDQTSAKEWVSLFMHEAVLRFHK